MTIQELNIEKIDNEVLFLGLKLYLTDANIKNKKDIFDLSDKDIIKYIKRKKITADTDEHFINIFQGDNLLHSLPINLFYK